MRSTALALLAAAWWAATASAVAHGGGDPHFRSEVRAITPAAKGLDVQVLDRDDRLLLTNRTGEDVVVDGYSKEPYARVLADGTVQVNTNSPAYYLNDDRYAAVKVPAHAKAAATPHWKEVDRTGRFEWHDHRIHWMAKTVPPQVHDKARRTHIFDWTVPIEVAGTPTRITGRLSWVPLPGGQAPLGLVFGVSAVLIALCVAVVVVRRRRPDAAGAAAGAGARPPSKEAW